MISYEEAMAKAGDESIVFAEAQHFLALATEIRLGIELRERLGPMTLDEARQIGFAASPSPAYETAVAKADAEHDPSGDARDLGDYMKRIGDAQTATMPPVAPVRQPVVDAVTERMTLAPGDRKCMHCGMDIYDDGHGQWLHKLSNQRSCYQRNTLAWPQAVDLR